MSYTDLLQSYQDRLSSMVQNEESVGDYLLNKSQDKINSYLESAGVPGQIGAVIDQIGILSNNSAVKTFLEKSGLKGVADEQIEGLKSTVSDLTNQVKAFGEKASAAIDRQVSNAQEASRPLLERSQQLIDTARTTEQQAKEAVSNVQSLAEQGESQARQITSEAISQGQEAVVGSQEFFNQIIEQTRRSANEPEPVEPVQEPEVREPTNYQVPEEEIQQPPPSQELTEFARDTSSISKDAGDVSKVATGIEETSVGEGEFGEIGEVVGALLQIGSLIASAFKPHEDVQTISTPISGFGFGSNNQFGIGGSSIV